jgi:hypothetical protein
VIPNLPEIELRSDGSIPGIDGLLDQVSHALGRRIIPMVREQIVPVLQQDRDLQMNIGKAIGRQLALPLWVLVGGAAVYAAVRIHRNREVRDKIDAAVRKVSRNEYVASALGIGDP